MNTKEALEEFDSVLIDDRYYGERAQRIVRIVRDAAEKWAEISPQDTTDIIDAARKWAVIEWMWEAGFADQYKFSSIMDNWKNYEDAYKKEKGEKE